MSKEPFAQATMHITVRNTGQEPVQTINTSPLTDYAPIFASVAGEKTLQNVRAHRSGQADASGFTPPSLNGSIEPGDVGDIILTHASSSYGVFRVKGTLPKIAEVTYETGPVEFGSGLASDVEVSLNEKDDKVAVEITITRETVIQLETTAKEFNVYSGALPDAVREEFSAEPGEDLIMNFTPKSNSSNPRDFFNLPEVLVPLTSRELMRRIYTTYGGPMQQLPPITVELSTEAAAAVYDLMLEPENRGITNYSILTTELHKYNKDTETENKRLAMEAVGELGLETSEEFEDAVKAQMVSMRLKSVRDYFKRSGAAVYAVEPSKAYPAGADSGFLALSANSSKYLNLHPVPSRKGRHTATFQLISATGGNLSKIVVKFDAVERPRVNFVIADSKIEDFGNWGQSVINKYKAYLADAEKKTITQILPEINIGEVLQGSSIYVYIRALAWGSGDLKIRARGNLKLDSRFSNVQVHESAVGALNVECSELGEVSYQTVLETNVPVPLGAVGSATTYSYPFASVMLANTLVTVKATVIPRIAENIRKMKLIGRTGKFSPVPGVIVMVDAQSKLQGQDVVPIENSVNSELAVEVAGKFVSEGGVVEVPQLAYNRDGWVRVPVKIHASRAMLVGVAVTSTADNYAGAVPTGELQVGGTYGVSKTVHLLFMKMAGPLTASVLLTPKAPAGLPMITPQFFRFTASFT